MKRTAALLVPAVLAVLTVIPATEARAQSPTQWTINSELAARFVAGKAALARSLTGRSYAWVGEPALLFVSISREIVDFGSDDGWVMYSCSADGPGDIDTDFWAARLELMLLDESGRMIYNSEHDDDPSAGGLCAFGRLDTWLEDELVNISFIEFPQELEPYTAVIYVSPEERSKVIILTSAYSPVYRPIEE